MEETLFTKIINGTIPCHKVYEDELTFAFLDIYPVQPGHTLVIPKRPVEFVWDLNDEDYAALMATTKLVAQRLRQVMTVPYIGSKVIGTDVPHAHVHLIPFSQSAHLHHAPDRKAEPNHAELSALVKTLAF